MQKYYVYNITNILIARSYIGTRQCPIEPIDDLGHQYFSSSQDKDFLQEQKEYPERFLYNIIEEFNTREEALEKEIELHAMFDVGNNKDFYNKSRQTSTGFVSDTSGMVPAFNIKEDIWGSWPKEEFDKDRDNYVRASDGKVAAFNIIENKNGLWMKEDFNNNRDNYIYTHDGMVPAFNIKENKSGSWPKEDFNKDRDNYICAGEGMVNAFNIKENKFGSWTKEDFNTDPENYLNGNSNAYKLIIDPTFISLPLYSKDYMWCLDRDTLGRVAFLKTDAVTRDKERFPSATGPGKKPTTIRNKRKSIPQKDLPKPIIWNKLLKEIQ